MSATQKLAPGIYLITGSRDADGQEYSAFRHIDGYWAVADSRGREVSRHASKWDAIRSVEVTR